MKKLLTFLCAVTIGINLFAAPEVIQIGSTDNKTSDGSAPAPINAYENYGLCQVLYLASDIGSVENANITKLAFYYKANAHRDRNVDIYITHSSLTKLIGFVNVTAADKVFSGSSTRKITMPSSADWYEITLDSPFAWNETSNILITIDDNSNSFTGSANTDHYAGYNAFNNRVACLYNHSGTNYDPTTATSYTATLGKHYPSIKLTFEAGASIPDVPSDFAVSATTSSSATLSWSAVSGATSYDLEQSADGSAWTTLASGETGTSYNWTGLSVASTQYARIRAVNAAGNSDWSDAVTVTTDAVHSHNGITFTKWATANAMPLSGNYYLANDVTITAITAVELSGDLNLCLNGHTIAFTHASGGIQIGSSETLAIYDAEEGGGLITSPNGTATVQVASNGSLAIHGGMIENSADAKAIKAIAGGDAAHLSIDVSDAKDNSAYFNLVSTSGGLVKNPADGSLDLRVNTNRSFTSAQYNTLCLPFPITDAQLSSIFGSGYDLEKFENASLDGEELTLTFTQVSNLEAGKPYLIKPAHDVANMSHPWSNIAVSEPVEDDSNPYISFHGTFKPTELAGGNKNLLFLGAGNELFWPESTGNLKGFRAYFEVKGAAQKATRARISKKEDHTTDIGDVRSENANAVRSEKILQNGQILIKRDGKTYNVLGSQIR